MDKGRPSGLARRLLRRRDLPVVLGAIAVAAGAQPLQLVSDEEAARERDAPPAGLTARALPAPDAPTISVRAPVIGATPIATPMRIELSFTAAPGAEIDPSSFRVHYGSLRLDLTARIVARVPVTRTGLAIDQVEIPRGQHRLLLRIADDHARIGETELRFTVQ